MMDSVAIRFGTWRCPELARTRLDPRRFSVPLPPLQDFASR